MATILVVDDDPGMRKPLARLLKMEGYDVVCAENAIMAMASALGARPDLILLDEPLAGLARDGVETMAALVRRVRDTGVSVVIIEHTMYAVVQLVDRLVVLDHGRRIAEGPPNDVVRDPAVIEAYLGKRWLRHVENLRTGPC